MACFNALIIGYFLLNRSPRLCFPRAFRAMRARSGIPPVRAHEGDGVVVVQRPEKIGLQILRPRDNVSRDTQSVVSRLYAVFERGPIGNLWGHAVHLAYLVWRSSSHLIPPSLLKSKWSRKNKSPSSENRPPLGL